ncbi:MAG: MucBP domain-containing protein, partial [Clostridia bacterium]|nr:MucBP domain-containing protein [Clostridia bacterium]
VNAPLTVNYVYENGSEAAETHTEDVEIFTDYSVNSPEITGYTPDKATVEGTMENLDGVTETVTYTAIEYTATFVDENGETVEEVPYTVETQSITEPDVPEKQGYFGEWENYTLAIGGVTVKPVYRNTTSIELEGYTESSESGYKEDRTFTAKAENLPEGAEIHWFVNGEDVGTGDICTVEDPTDDYTVQAKVIDKDGNTLDETKVQPVKVKNGFFDRLKAFFAELIEKILGKAIADLLGSVC